MPEQGPRMNGFSLGELCWLFCCPPCPSRIAAKLAFLPPEPTYSVHTDPNGVTSLHLSERADWQYSQRELDAVEVLSTRSSRGNRVGCMFVRCAPNSRYTLLFSHGNAVDLGQMCSFYIGLGSRINCNVFSYDYSGYGVSTGKPSEKNLYADIEAAWQVLRNKWVRARSVDHYVIRCLLFMRWAVQEFCSSWEILPFSLSSQVWLVGAWIFISLKIQFNTYLRSHDSVQHLNLMLNVINRKGGSCSPERCKERIEGTEDL